MLSCFEGLGGTSVLHLLCLDFKGNVLHALHCKLNLCLPDDLFKFSAVCLIFFCSQLFEGERATL